MKINSAYTYQFRHENEQVIVKVDHIFEDICDLEDLSRYSHQIRRNLARFILENLEMDTFYQGPNINYRSPFLNALNAIFNNRYWCYWTRRHSDILIYFTGFLAFSFMPIFFKFHRLFIGFLVWTTVSSEH